MRREPSRTPAKSTHHRGHEEIRELILPLYAVDDALDSVTQVEKVEIDSQTHRYSTQMYAGQQLRLWNWMEGPDGFSLFLFHHDSITTTQCSTIRSMRSDFELMALIDHGRGHFSCDVETAASQFLRQAGLVGTFQQTRAEARRNLARGIDDRTGDFIYRTCRRGRLMHTRFTHDRGALGKTGEQTILLDFAPELGAGVFGIQFG
jgi:hypothetical protein